MRFLNLFGFLKTFDIFKTKQFFRYNSNQQHRSFFAGSLSFILLIVFIIVLYQNLMACMNRQNVNSTSQTVNSVIPTLLNISTYPQERFMMAIGVPGVDLNIRRPQYFDLIVTNQFTTFNQSSGDSEIEIQEIVLEPCKNRHWALFPELANDLKLINLEKLVCLPLNTTLSLNGKAISNSRAQIEISLTYCSKRYLRGRVCAKQNEMKKLFKKYERLELRLYFTNVRINAEKSEYLSYFLDDRYHASFALNYLGVTSVFVQDYTIETDHAIYPFEGEDVGVEKGALVEQKAITKMLIEGYERCAFIYIQKSFSSKFYKRSFGQITDVFGLIGGLFSIVTACIFFIQSYNFSHFQIQIAAEIVTADQRQDSRHVHTKKSYSLDRKQPNIHPSYPNQKDQNQLNLYHKYGFLHFIKQGIYNLMGKCGFQLKWKDVQQYNKCENQIKQQLDTLYIIQRFWYLEAAISIMLEEHQIKGLYLRPKITLNQAKQARESMELGKQVTKLGKNTKNKLKKAASLQLEQNSSDKVHIRRTNSFNLNSFEQQIFVSSQEQKQTQRYDSWHATEGVNDASQEVSVTQDRTQQDQYRRDTQQIELQTQTISSQISESPRKVEQRLSMLKQMIKIEDEARTGKRISRKIMIMANAQRMGFNELTDDGTGLTGVGVQVFHKKNERENALIHDFQQTEKQKTKIKHQECEDILKENPKFTGNLHGSELEEQMQENNRKILKCVCKWIQTQDWFSTSEYFRFNSQLSHGTICGGAVSLVVAMVFCLLSYGSIQSCIDRTKVFVQSSTKLLSDPPLMKFQTYPRTNFMAMVPMKFSFQEQNSSQYRYVDVMLVNRIKYWDDITEQWQENVRTVRLQECTREHFQWFVGVDLLEKFYDIENEICFPLNESFQIQGKLSSDRFASLELVVKRCSNQSDDKRPCSAETVRNFFYYGLFIDFSLLLTNPVISPTSQNYLSYYIEERIAGILARYLSFKADFYLQDFSIKTDWNIFPFSFSDETVETGLKFEDLPVVTSRSETPEDIDSKQFAKIRFFKSNISRFYLRTYSQLIDTIAIFGGVFSLFASSLFIMNSYNNYAYQMSIGAKIFKTDSTKHIFKSYNFITFIRQILYAIVKFFGNPPKWKDIEQYLKCQQEIQKQLDVLHLIERLNFVETAISTILQDHQIKILHLREKPSFKDAKRHRRDMRMKRQIRKEQLIMKKINQKKDFITQNKTYLLKKQMLESKLAQSMFDQSENQSPMNLVGQSRPSAVLSEFSFHKATDQKQLLDLLEENVILSDFSGSEETSSIESDGQEPIGQTILEQISKIKEEARRGDRVSLRIANLTGKESISGHDHQITDQNICKQWNVLNDEGDSPLFLQQNLDNRSSFTPTKRLARRSKFAQNKGLLNNQSVKPSF